MSAPPVLRPLRAILQRRLQILPSRPTRTPYYLRAAHYRTQFRYNSSIPPDGSPKPQESVREASSEQNPDNESTSTANTTEGEPNATTTSPAGDEEGVVTTNFEIPEHDAIIEAAIPQLDNTLVKSAFQHLKATDAEIQAGIAEALARHLATDESTTVAVGDAAAEIESSPTADPIAKPVEAESEFVVDPIPDTLPLEEETVVAMTEELERLEKKPEDTDTEPELPLKSESSERDAITDASDQIDTLESAVAAERSAHNQEEASSVDNSLDAVLHDELPSVPESRGSSAITDNAEQIDTLEPAVASESSVHNQDEAPSMEDSLDAARDEALAAHDRDQHAQDLAAKEVVEAYVRRSLGEIEAREVSLYEGPEPSRLPRNVAAYYLQPLRRVAEYGVPACDLQLRSYSIRPLESFCDFALRAAYYLGLPAYGPVPLPKIIERWTVPRSHFIFKKSQENFERITRRRLIQIKDANPETVQIWLAFLQKHQQAAVGMKANIWEFSSIDVAKEMDEAFREAEPSMNEKYRLLQQTKDFETVEKVDEFLQATRYKVTGDQVERNQ